MIQNFDRVVPTIGIHNFRDYGGYAVTGGGRVVTGKLYRSAQHRDATPEDLDRIAQLDLAVVVDLRGARERTAAPCPRPSNFTAKVIATDEETASIAPHLQAAEGIDDANLMHERMLKVYDDIAFRPTLNVLFSGYFAALAEQDGASLIHCLAGKDRTGVGVALLHKLLGVHDDDIMADYLLTNTVGDIEARIAAGAAFVRKSARREVSEDAMRVIMSVQPEYLDRAFAAIKARHGGHEAYLRDVHGVDAQKTDTIRARLIV